MYIVEAFIAVIFNQTPNSRHFRLLTWLITFFSGSFKEHQVQFKVLAMQYGLNNFQCQESVVYNAERSALFDAFFIDFREEQLLEVSMSDTKFLN
ncbi:hypothetical protein T4D_1 [Trichinella pseudospiralis]|uniref:Uncharacterized protein n=1 Tax=Trichinella pseudospiralis TaxID=6337 RepID=A0A0V1FTK9_TRIPS|nr:hypothetical protein T4D_1 [Trichinella pseudospiralis]